MPGNQQRRPGKGGAADTSLAGDGPQITKPSSEFQAAIERTSELDRAWFRLHPERAHRVRRATAPERQNEKPPGCSLFIVVKQVVPGLRMRAGFWGTRDPCCCETCAADLWVKFAPAKFQAMAVEAAAIMLRRNA